MLICDACKQLGDIEGMIRCGKCGRIYHKHVKCVKVREVVFDKEKRCPMCGKKTKKINIRTCPVCGEHLWSLHIDCGGIF